MLFTNTNHTVLVGTENINWQELRLLTQSEPYQHESILKEVWLECLVNNGR